MKKNLDSQIIRRVCRRDGQAIHAFPCGTEVRDGRFHQHVLQHLCAMVVVTGQVGDVGPNRWMLGGHTRVIVNQVADMLQQGLFALAMHA